MIAAFSLLLASQDAVKPPGTFEEILQAANKAWYELPQATTRVLFETGETRVNFVEGRDGGRFFFRVKNGAKPVVVARSNGQETVTLIYGEREYTVAPSGPRPGWANRKVSSEEAESPTGLQVKFEQDRGLRVSLETSEFEVTRDVRGTKDGVGVRLVSAVLGGSEEADAENRISFTATLDAKLGYIRKATIIVNQAPAEDGKPVQPVKIVWSCEAKPPQNPDYSFDVTRLRGWTRLEGTKPSTRE